MHNFDDKVTYRYICPMDSTAKKIAARIEAARPRTIFFTEDFRDMGQAEAVKSALHRLVQRGIIHRLARGIYVKPAYFELINKEVVPSIEQIARAIARRDKVRMMPSGEYALNLLGLSTQVPVKIIYLTDGSPRTIQIAGRQIIFKRTSPRNLSYRGRISALAVQALKAIGRHHVTRQDKDIILKKLTGEDYHNLKHDIKIAPQWIAEILNQAIKK